MKKIFILFHSLNVVILILCSGCRKNTETIPGNEVAIYLLKSFEKEDNSCQIREETVILEKEELIAYADLLAYHPKTYHFDISENAISRLETLQFPVDGIGFGVLAAGELIYTGYFWPSYSSASCQWTVIDPLLVGLNKTLKVRQGYPGKFDESYIPDRRNDRRITSIFKRDGKLVD